jgi:hypothetical protein
MYTGHRNFIVVGILTFATLIFGVAAPSAAEFSNSEDQRRTTAISPPFATKAAQVAGARKMLKSLKNTRYTNLDYDRNAQFGNGWTDVDDNNCETRDDILKRDLTNETFDDRCVVRTGILKDPYTGKKINFLRGVSTSRKVQIDHIIALHLAWLLGASKWSKAKRVAFANDPINLLATDGPTNASKSDSGPEEWLPPQSGYRCTYVIRFIRIAYLYKVGVTSASRSTMTSVLNSCKSIVGNPATMSPLPPSLWR